MAVTILMVEDDTNIRSSLRMALEEEGYAVVEAGSGEEALDLIQERHADVITVDIMLPGMDGFETCRNLRRSTAIPIIVVTARADTHDVVAGLEAGADDYVTKPFEAKELTARMRALLRRSRIQEDRSERCFGDVVVRPEEGLVTKAGEEVHLTTTEFRLLCELIEADGKVLPRERLLERVWDYEFFGDTRLVDVHIRRLRTKIEDDPASPVHVQTVRGMGYKLVS